MPNINQEGNNLTTNPIFIQFIDSLGNQPIKINYKNCRINHKKINALFIIT